MHYASALQHCHGMIYVWYYFIYIIWIFPVDNNDNILIFDIYYYVLIPFTLIIKKVILIVISFL